VDIAEAQVALPVAKVDPVDIAEAQALPAVQDPIVKVVAPIVQAVLVQDLAAPVVPELPVSPAFLVSSSKSSLARRPVPMARPRARARQVASARPRNRSKTRSSTRRSKTSTR